MAWCRPARTARATALTRSGGTAPAPRYCSLVRKDSVALAPEPAAVGDGWVAVMAPPGGWLSATGEEGDVVVADEVRHRPAVQVVLGQAGLGEPLHGIGLALRLRGEEQLGADVLVVAGVVALVQLVPAAELGADGVPQGLHDLDPVDRVDAVGAADVLVEVGADLGGLEVAGVGVEVDQPAGDVGLDDLLDSRVALDHEHP